MRKMVRLALLAVFLGSAFAADWRSDMAGFFSTPPVDYKAAAAYLNERFDSLSEDDKPIACGLLAYLYGQSGDKSNEYARLGDYFEKYGLLGLGFDFLPPSVHASVAGYLRDWQLKYPWVFGIGFVESTSVTSVPFSANPPETLVLGVEMANVAYYKLLDDGGVLKGGLFRRGFNSVSIETKSLLWGSGTRPYYLELKAGDLIVRRELAIDVHLEAVGVVAKAAQPSANQEYTLKMFLGNKLLASSRISLPSPPLNIEVPPPGGVYDPFGPGYQNDPKLPNAFPIAALPAAIYDLIKRLTKRGEVEPVPPVELKSQVAFSFNGKDDDGDPIEFRARLELDQRKIGFFPFNLGEESQNSKR
jgi:hypothetical protein